MNYLKLNTGDTEIQILKRLGFFLGWKHPQSSPLWPILARLLPTLLILLFVFLQIICQHSYAGEDRQGRVNL